MQYDTYYKQAINLLDHTIPTISELKVSASFRAFSIYDDTTLQPGTNILVELLFVE